MHLSTHIFILLLYNAVALLRPTHRLPLGADAKLMYEPRENPEIVVMNHTNFNSELIQHDHPFAHIKLIEYGVAYCGICVKFKHTFIQLSKDIFSWRNVIRPAAIDLAVSNNSPIAESWSIEIVPLIRIHPPPSPLLAAKLDKQLSAWSATFSEPINLQRAMYREYNATHLMIKTLGVLNYTTDPKRGNVPEKAAALKHELLRYIEDFVRLHPDDLPATWPNLRPVSERTLTDLKRHHPRQELFLVIEGGNRTSDSPSLGLQVLMELSSSPSWKALRYVHASENRELVEDVIAQKRGELGEQSSASSNQSLAAARTNQQVELLENFLANSSGATRDVLLVHVDGSHSSNGDEATKFSFLTVISGSDLIVPDVVPSVDTGAGASRAKRALSDGGSPAGGEDQGGSSIKRKLELVGQFVGKTYSETKEDQLFMEALRSFDKNPTDHNQEIAKKYQAVRDENQKQQNEEIRNINKSQQSSMSQMTGVWDSLFSSVVQARRQTDDYDDKLKAIRYIFFNEVPRALLADKSVPEQLERLTTLINLASVIKTYFPLPDLASVQFIDAIHSYLSLHKGALVASLSQQDRVTSNFELRSLRQFIKNLEAEGKRLPEVRNWKHCKQTNSSYPCGLWRLFHTLTAFEYKKLSQINQLLGSSSSQAQASNISAPSQQTVATSEVAQPSGEQQQQQQAQAQVSEATPAPSGGEQQMHGPPQSPVERLVSPPSTSASLSLTIATPTSSSQGAQQQQQQSSINQNNIIIKTQETELAELPVPVLLVMRDYITQFFSCEECAKNWQQEAAELSLERIRHQEPAEFSILWLWETHNRVSKRLSVNPETNPPAHPKVWYPTYEQCSKCYKKPPSYLNDKTVELAAIFHESIEWNRDETLSFLLSEFTRQPMDMGTNIFGYTVPHGFNFIIVIGLCSLFLVVLLRCASCYIERQRRHKASLLNGNGAHYSVELQSC